VAYFTHDLAAPVTHETDRAVGGAAQALARAGVEVEVAQPSGLIADSRGIDQFWQDLAGAPGRTVVEFYGQWDRLRTRLLRFMAHYDALLCPVDSHPAPPFSERDPRRFDYTVPFSLNGYTAVVVRVGADPQGLPIGVQLVARPWREDVALALARLLEQEFGGWRPPPLPAMSKS
jgi:amidase